MANRGFSTRARTARTSPTVEFVPYYHHHSSGSDAPLGNIQMPVYEYRCAECGAVTSTLASINAIPEVIECACGGTAARIISRPSVHLSRGSKVARLDPKYDAMVDRAMRNTPTADPDRLVNRRGDIAKGRDDP